jgi:SAM-dependent methyltransferase
MKSTDKPEFWRNRILRAIATGKDLHTVIYDVDINQWNRIQGDCGGYLTRHLKYGDKLLDAGCGYGALWDALPSDLKKRVKYTGVDFSPELIEIGKIRRPTLDLICADLMDLDYPEGYFNLVICRSMKKMIIDNSGIEVWCSIENKLSYIGKEVYLLEYDGLTDVEFKRLK